MALNDEAGSVRALAISAVGRLAGLNPGYILPAARKHLIQLLNDMEHSPDSRQRQGRPQQLSHDLTDNMLIWHGNQGPAKMLIVACCVQRARIC